MLHARGQSTEHSSFTTAARRQTEPLHHTHNFCWHGPRQRSHGEGNRYFYQLVVGTGATILNFGDADTTQKAMGATSAQMDFVCVICTSNSSTAAVASLSLPVSLSLCLCSRAAHTTISPFLYLPFYFFAATTKCLFKRHLFPTTSAQIYTTLYVYYVPVVLLLLLPLFLSLYLSLSVFVQGYLTQQYRHFSTCPFIFSQL